MSRVTIKIIPLLLSIIAILTAVTAFLYFTHNIQAASLDNADTASNWVSSDTSLLSVAQETTIKQEGTGSTKLTPTANWYNYSWPYRLKLTIEADKVDADLTDYPVYLNLANLPSSFHSHVNQTDARDIRITKGDGTTELPREVVFYNSSTDTGEVHFKYSGTLSGTTDTDVYIYYGNTGASDYATTATYGRNNVWDSAYKGVWHLNESSGTHYDSTSNNNDSTAISVATQGTANAKIGGADDFNGTTSYINLGTGSSLDFAGDATLQAWIYPEGWGEGGYGSIVARGAGSSKGYEFYTRSTGTQIAIWDASGAFGNTVTLNTWALATFTVTGTSGIFYLNGTSSAESWDLASSGSNNAYIGSLDGSTDTFDGQLDEVRLSSSVRASTWISTEYNNQNSPSTFFNFFGTEQAITGQTATRTISATDLSSYGTLSYWVRSDRTGSFMRFQFGESASSEQTNSISINSANTWEQKTWDISAIAGASRDAVTKFAFYVTDASTNFSFYFDDVQANLTNSAPATPSLDTPANSATNQSLTPALKTTTTDADSDYLRYKIELCTNVGMSAGCQTFDQTSSQTGWSGQNTQSSTAYTSGTQATYTVQSALATATTYYWRSYGIDPGGTNSWSSTQGSPYSFTTTTAPSAPTTPYAEGATNPTGIVDLTPEFSSVHNDPDGDAATYYEIEVNTASNFGGTVMWDTGATSMSSLADGVRSTDVSYAGTSLSYNNTTYYWRIRFFDNKGATGAWSATANFSTNSAPGIPTLDAPADTATGVSVTPALQTTTTDTHSDYLRYKIELCENVGMSTNCQTFDQTSSQTGWSGQNTQTSTAYTSGTQATYTVQSALSYSFTYYWRSYAIDPGGTNTWSATQGSPYSFTTDDAPPDGGGNDSITIEGVSLEGISVQ